VEPGATVAGGIAEFPFESITLNCPVFLLAKSRNVPTGGFVASGGIIRKSTRIVPTLVKFVKGISGPNMALPEY
jgi:hypothetical protein